MMLQNSENKLHNFFKKIKKLSNFYEKNTITHHLVI